MKRGGILDRSNDTGLAEHFAQEDHDFEADLELYILEKGQWKRPSDGKAKFLYLPSLNSGTTRVEQVCRILR